MKKIIFVNATAATEGGILVILKQFIDEIIDRNDKNNVYYIFVSNKLEVDYKNIHIVSDIKGKSKIDRVKWDMFGIKRWSLEQKIYPDIIISLQNTGIRFKHVPQIVYIQQSLPYAKESKWNIIKSDERRMWFYKYIYKLWIDLSVKNKADIVVQTEWMKQELLNRGYNKNEIIVATPSIKNIDIKEISINSMDKKYLFYPAADYKYKNHIILIKAVKKIVDEYKVSESFKIVFTLNKDSNIYKKVIEHGLEQYFEFVGELIYEEVMKYYKGCHAVLFPSYIETFGLPLIESATFGKKILVSDCSYSREVISNYKLSTFIKYDDVDEWSKSIISALDIYDNEPFNIRPIQGWENVFNKINDKINY